MKLKWLSTRDLVARPGAALSALPRDGVALLTTNGKPRALLLPVDEASFPDDITAILGFLGAQGLKRAQGQSVANGRAKLGDGEIDAVIARSRAARRRPRR